MKNSNGLATSGAQQTFMGNVFDAQIHINDLVAALQAYESNLTGQINAAQQATALLINQHANQNFGNVHEITIGAKNWRDSSKDIVAYRWIRFPVNHSTLGLIFLYAPLSTTPISPT